MQGVSQEDFLIAEKIRTLRDRCEFDAATSLIQGLSSVRRTPIVAIAHVDLLVKQRLYIDAEKVAEDALVLMPQTPHPSYSTANIVLRLQLALIRCNTKGAVIDASQFCESIKDLWLGDVDQLANAVKELPMETVLMEKYFHRIVLFRIDFVDGNHKLRAAVARRLEKILHRLVREARFDEALDIAEVCAQADPDAECVSALVMIGHYSKNKLIQGMANLLLARVLVHVHSYDSAEAQLGSAERHFEACGHAAGLVDVKIARALCPQYRTTAMLDELKYLRETCHSTSYLAGEIDCLVAIYDLSLENRQFPSLHFARSTLQDIQDKAGCNLLWCQIQLSGLAGASLESGRSGAILECVPALVAFMETAKFQTPVLTAQAHVIYALVLMDLGKRREAVEYAQRSFDSHIARNSLEASNVLLVLTQAKSMPHGRSPAQQKQDLQECIELLATWAERDGADGLDQQQVEKYSSLADLQSRLVTLELNQIGSGAGSDDLVAKRIAYNQALAWLDKADEISRSRIVEDRLAFHLADISFRRHRIYALIGDLGSSYEALQSARDLFMACGSTHVWWMLEEMGLNRLEFATANSSAGDLSKALSHLEEAKKGLEQSGSLKRLAKCYYRIAIASREAHALPKALENVEAAALKWNEIRQEFSVLPGVQSLADKHELISQGEATYHLGIELYFQSKDAAGLWSWVQRGKARGLLDIMGLGATIPQAMLQKFVALPDVMELLERERLLTEQLQLLPAERRFDLRRNLAEIWARMKGRPELRELLVMRGHIAVDIQDLTSTFQGTGKVVLVDWVYFQQTILLVVAWPNGESQMFELSMSVGEVLQWKRNHLSGSLEDLRDDEALDFLDKLNPLTAPLKDITTSEDLLILSPSGHLNGLPLHALQVDGQLLLERNRVIYSYSLSILHHSMSNRHSASESSMGRTVIFGNPAEDRAHGTSSAKALGNLFNVEPLIGKDATHRAFSELAPQAALLHFHGHAKHDTTVPLDSALLMAAKEKITARDIFDYHLKAKLVTLIACESGATRMGPGDDPTGLIPAFLYAGTSAVLGTLWKVPDNDGRAFSETFYARFGDKGGVVDLAMALQQAALAIRAKKPMPYFWAPYVLHGNWLCRWIPCVNSVPSS